MHLSTEKVTGRASELTRAEDTPTSSIYHRHDYSTVDGDDEPGTMMMSIDPE